MGRGWHWGIPRGPCQPLPCWDSGILCPGWLWSPLPIHVWGSPGALLGGRQAGSLLANCASPAASARALPDDLTHGTSVPAGCQPGGHACPPCQVRQGAQAEDLEGLRGPHGEPGPEGQAVRGQGERLAEQGRGRWAGCRVSAGARRNPRGFCLGYVPTVDHGARPPRHRAGSQWEEVKRSGGEGKSPRRVGKGWWVPWGPAGCCSDALALPAEGCLCSAELPFPLLPVLILLAPVQAGAELLESSSAERDWECWGTTG